jgi:hypothetical protein
MSDRFLVDTDVLSAGAPSKAQAISQLIAWLDRNSERLYVSVVTIAEIEDGIAKSKRQGSTRKAARLREWLETLVHLYSPRILPFDLAAARIAGTLSDRARGGRVRRFGNRRDRPASQPHDPYTQHQALHPTRARGT